MIRLRICDDLLMIWWRVCLVDRRVEKRSKQGREGVRREEDGCGAKVWNYKVKEWNCRVKERNYNVK